MNGPYFLIPIFAVAFGIPFVLAPLARALSKRLEAGTEKADPDLVKRLTAIERNVDIIAVEVEKMAESQRFLTRLLADRERAAGALPPGTH